MIKRDKKGTIIEIVMDENGDIPEELSEIINSYQEKWTLNHASWKNNFKQWEETHSDKASLLLRYNESPSKHSKTLLNVLKDIETKENCASRASSQTVINQLCNTIPNIIGGSADLSCSDSTFIKSSGIMTKDNFEERNIKYGVREFAMAAIASGLVLSKLFASIHSLGNDTKMLLPIFCRRRVNVVNLY